MTPADGGAAFPIPNERDQWGDGIAEGSRGMSLRDWFAGQALAGQLANSSAICDGVGEPSVSGLFAKDAYALADAMLAERAK
jgi:hypothetical protein